VDTSISSGGKRQPSVREKEWQANVRQTGHPYRQGNKKFAAKDTPEAVKSGNTEKPGRANRYSGGGEVEKG